MIVLQDEIEKECKNMTTDTITVFHTITMSNGTIQYEKKSYKKVKVPLTLQFVFFW